MEDYSDGEHHEADNVLDHEDLILPISKRSNATQIDPGQNRPCGNPYNNLVIVSYKAIRDTDRSGNNNPCSSLVHPRGIYSKRSVRTPSEL